MLVILVVIAFLIIPISGVALFQGIIQALKVDTIYNRLLLLISICFFMGIFYDNLRLLSFFFLGGIHLHADIIGFNVKSFLLFFGMNLEAQLFLKYGEKSQHDVKIEKRIEIFFYSILILFSIINVYTFIPLHTILGYYVYTIQPVLLIVMLICYAPLLAYVLVKSYVFLHKMKGKPFRKKYIFGAFLFGLLTIERIYSLNFVKFIFVAFPAPIVDSVLFLSDFIILLGISIGFLILILKHHELFETVNAYFSLKSIHIIRNGGQLLFGYDFKEEKFEDISDSHFPRAWHYLKKSNPLN